MESGERNNIFLAWLLIVAALVGFWVFQGYSKSDEDRVRESALTALRSISQRDAAGICRVLSPRLIEEIKQLNFTEFQFSLPDKLFCLQAAQIVFSRYGDYYITPSSFYQMRTAKISIQDEQALVFFRDGDRQNISKWVEEDGVWKLRSGVDQLIDDVASRGKPIPARPPTP